MTHYFTHVNFDKISKKYKYYTKEELEFILTLYIYLYNNISDLPYKFYYY